MGTRQDDPKLQALIRGAGQEPDEDRILAKLDSITGQGPPPGPLAGMLQKARGGIGAALEGLSRFRAAARGRIHEEVEEALFEERELDAGASIMRAVPRVGGQFVEAAGQVAQAAAAGAERRARAADERGDRRIAPGAHAAISKLLRGAGEKVEAAGESFQAQFPRSPSQQTGQINLADPQFYIDQVPEALVQLGSQLALAGMTGGAGPIAQFGAFAGPVAVLEAGEGYERGRDRALALGAAPAEAEAAGAGAALIRAVGSTAIEAVPARLFLFNRSPKVAQVFYDALTRRLGADVGRIAGDAAAGAAVEGIEEVAQEAWGDAVHYAQVNDPAAFNDWVSRYGAAGIVGGIAGGGAHVAQGVAHDVRTDDEGRNAVIAEAVKMIDEPPVEQPAPAAPVEELPEQGGAIPAPPDVVAPPPQSEPGEVAEPPYDPELEPDPLVDDPQNPANDAPEATDAADVLDQIDVILAGIQKGSMREAELKGVREAIDAGSDPEEFRSILEKHGITDWAIAEPTQEETDAAQAAEGLEGGDQPPATEVAEPEATPGPTGLRVRELPFYDELYDDPAFPVRGKALLGAIQREDTGTVLPVLEGALQASRAKFREEAWRSFLSQYDIPKRAGKALRELVTKGDPVDAQNVLEAIIGHLRPEGTITGGEGVNTPEPSEISDVSREMSDIPQSGSETEAVESTEVEKEEDARAARVEARQEPWQTETRDPPVKGRTQETLFGTDRRVHTQYVVMEAADVIASHDPESFERRPPEEIAPEAQGRAYEGKRGKQAREYTINARAQFDPRRAVDLTESAAEGPPVVTPSGRVIAGHGRTLIVQGLPSQKATTYKRQIAERAAALGLDNTQAVLSMQQPILVRVLTPESKVDWQDPAQLRELNMASDQAATKAKDPASDAQGRAEQFLQAEDALRFFNDTVGEEDTVLGYLSGKNGREFLRRLVESGVITQTEMAQFVDPNTGAPTKAGKELVERIFYAAALGDADVLQRAPKNMLNRIETSLPAIIRANGVGGEWALGETVGAALDIISSARANGLSVLEQVQLIDPFRPIDPQAGELAMFLDSTPKRKVRPVFARYAQMAAESVQQAQSEDLFGQGPVTAAEAWEQTFGDDRPETMGFPGHQTRSQRLGRPRHPAAMDMPKPGPTPNPTQNEKIAEWLDGNLEGPPLKPRERVSAERVMRALAHTITKLPGWERRPQPFRVGRLNAGRGTLGWFNPRTYVIRLLEANDLPTAVHELGHALEVHWLGWVKGSPWKLPLVDSTIQAELVKLGQALYGNTQPAGGYKREGWAEFLRAWLTDHRMVGSSNTLERDAPALSKWFNETYLEGNAELKESLLKARELMRRWRAQGSRERGLAQIHDPNTVRERARREYNRLLHDIAYSKWVDEAKPLKEFAEEAERLMARKLRPSENPYKIQKALRLVHHARIRYMVEQGMMDLAGNKVGPALLEIRELVKGKQQEFTLYLFARRARYLWATDRNPGLSRQDTHQILDELGSDAFEKAAAKFYEWYDGVMDYVAQASPLFAEIVRRTREAETERAAQLGLTPDYLPLQRLFEDVHDIWRKGQQRSSRAALAGSIVKRLRGSGRAIKDPMQTVLAQAARLMKIAHERMVVDRLVKLSNVEGMGRVIERVPPDQVPSHFSLARALREVQEGMAGMGLDLEVVDPQTGDPVELDPHDLAGKYVTFFSQAYRPTKGADPIVVVYQGGQPVWYQVDAGLYEALEGMEMDTFFEQNIFTDWMLLKPAKLMRAGTVSLNASFGLVANFLRDPQSMALNSRASANAFHLFGAWVEMVVRALGYRTRGKTHNAMLDMVIRLGIEMAQPLGEDIPHTKRAVHRLFETRGQRLLNVTDWFDAYRDFVQFSELAPRAAEMKMVAKDVGWDPNEGQPITLDQSIELLIAGKEVTTDFTAAGSLVRRLNRITPFMNAAIQGPRTTIRAAKRDPVKVLTRGLAMAGITLAAWFRHKDDDWWLELPHREKFLYWHQRLPGTDEVVRIPRAFEIGLFFAALPEMLADAAYRQDPENVGPFFETALKTTLPPTPVLESPLLSEYIQQKADQDSFWKRPIVGRLERQFRQEQYNEYTSRAAIKLADLFAPELGQGALSPVRIDHAIRGIGGGAAAGLLDLLGLGPAEIDRDPELADLPISGRLFLRGGASPQQAVSVDELYDAFEYAQKLQAVSWYEESDGDRQGRLLLMDATRAVSAMSWVRSHTKSVQERRALNEEILEIAKDALAAYNARALDRERFQQIRRDSEATREEMGG